MLLWLNCECSQPAQARQLLLVLRFFLFRPAAHGTAAADDHDYDSPTACPASVFAPIVLQSPCHADPDAASPCCSVLFLVVQLRVVHAGLTMPSGFHRG